VLKRYSEVFRTLMIVGDMTLVSVAWWLAYLLRFNSTVLGLPPGTPNTSDYLLVGMLAVLLVYGMFRHRGLYESRRSSSRLSEVGAIVAVMAAVTIVLSTIPFFLRFVALSRAVVLLFWAFSTVGLICFRLWYRVVLAQVRRRGRNQRSLIIVGTGRLAEQVAARFESNPEMGFKVQGFVGPKATVGKLTPNLGAYADLQSVVLERGIDQVIVAIERTEPVNVAAMVDCLRNSTASVRIAPDITGLQTVRPAVEDFDGIPMISIVESPILGWNSITKRVFDVLVAGAASIFLAPVMAVIAILIKAGNPRAPVIYRQTRMSMDGRSFPMLKFRTMVPDAEAATGPKWAEAGDRRRTRIGGFLRRANLDELPQLWNVLSGDMSVVGPRPERPAFVEKFREELPGYMVRHKIKGGLTGWAQVNGLRGNTSLTKRLEYDIDYVRRWSLKFDVQIVAMTLARSFRDPNAY